MHLVTLLALSRLAAAAGPLTLDDALALAARRNADVEIARAEQDAAGAQTRGTYPGVLPRLDLTGAFGRQWNGAQEIITVLPNPSPPPDLVRVPVTTGAADFGAHQLGLTLSWTLFDGLASWNAISAARARESSAGRLYDETSLGVAFEVTRRFYDLLKQQQALDVARDTAARSADLVKRADALFSAGRGTKADTYLARVNLGNDELAVRTQQAAVVRARADLAFVLGLTSDAGLEVAPPAVIAAPGPLVAQELPPLPALLASARKGRPLLTARRLAGEAADLEVSRAQGAYWPVVGLQASYVRAAPDLTGTNGVFSSLSNGYVATVQATLALNLFAGGLTRANVQLAEAQARRAQAVLLQGEEQVADEIAIARAQVESLAASVPIAQQNVDAADKGLRYARERLEAGVGSQLEVRDATLKLAQAQLAAFDSVVDLVVARANLNRSVGGGL